MNLYMVSAFDPDEYKGSNDRGRFVFADSAQEAFDFWKAEHIEDFDGDESCLPTFDCVIRLPALGERGIVYGEVEMEGDDV